MNATAIKEEIMNTTPQKENPMTTTLQSQPIQPATQPKPSLLSLTLVFLFRVLALSLLGLLVGLVNLLAR